MPTKYDTLLLIYLFKTKLSNFFFFKENYDTRQKKKKKKKKKPHCLRKACVMTLVYIIRATF